VRSSIFLSLCVPLLLAPVSVSAKGSAFHPASVEVWFSPRGGCAEACVKAIAAAKSTIYVQAYSFTSASIAKALVAAHARGVAVEVVLDKSQRSDRYTSADFVAHAGIPTRIDAKHAIAHNKVMIIDGNIVITGSFNFTKAAEESNAENMLILRDAKLADRYLSNWSDHKAHSEVYAGR
jgi:phosphatidylserine/phosphatidylglycerophosphate/cardiolipin synthase-like enzyme